MNRSESFELQSSVPCLLLGGNVVEHLSSACSRTEHKSHLVFFRHYQSGNVMLKKKSQITSPTIALRFSIPDSRFKAVDDICRKKNYKRNKDKIQQTEIKVPLLKFI